MTVRDQRYSLHLVGSNLCFALKSWPSDPPTRNASASSAASGIELDTGFRVSYGSTSRSTSGNWDDATDPHTPKDANALYHARALDRQATITQATFTASRMDDLSGGQYSPQRFDSGLGKDSGHRFSSVPSPTRPTLSLPGYSGSQSPDASSSIGHYNTLPITSSVNGDSPSPSCDMPVEGEIPNSQTLVVPHTSPRLLPPPRPYNYAPPPDYNAYRANDFQYGYGHPEPGYGSSTPVNPSTSSALYHGMPTPQGNSSGVPVPLYFYDTTPLPLQYYLPLSQNVMYSQLHPLPSSSHSPMAAPQLPVTMQDKKRDLLQYALNMHHSRTNFFQTSPPPYRQPYPDHMQYFIPPGLVPLPLTIMPSNMRGGRSWPGQSETDAAAALRSPLLEEFRANKTRKWELRDISGHAVEFSGDQHGSRFLQQKLESATSEEKQAIFDEIVPANAFSLMVDVFGNYVIQKLFEHGTQVQKIRLAQTMEGRIHGLSQQMYGCRVVQKAIEFVLPEQQTTFIKELEPHILKCVKDPNGNHVRFFHQVIQKLVECVSSDNLGFIQKFRDNVHDLATHPYGCRVLQRCLEHLPEETTRHLMDELHKYATNLMQDQFGNYVMQYILEHGRPHDKMLIIAKIHGQILILARHKFASNVCEKALVCADPETRRRLIDEILTTKPDGVTPITGMMKDQYANYVLQRAMNVATGDQKERLFTKVIPQVQSMRRHSGAHSKHLVAIERLIEKHTPTVKP
ncbi:Pumilio like protein [Termitomyces sp. J132]|nr:Pumilio like protein [Termitomyces sp. J132]